MFTANPEEMVIASTDGEVTVTGIARESAPLAITTVADARPKIENGGSSISKSYLIKPDVTPLTKPVVLTWQLAPVADAESVATGLAPAVDDGVVTAGLAVYRFNEDSLMWEMVLPIVAYSDTMLAVETSILGTFALGKREMVTVPEFVEVYKDILVSRPEEAVGFVTTVGYARKGESIVKLPSGGQQGGCGGAVKPGVSEQKSTVTRDVTLLVDDVQTKVTLTFFTRWLMGDGCPVDEPFIAAQNYGILPTS